MSLKRVIVVNIALLAMVGSVLPGCGGDEPAEGSGGSAGMANPKCSPCVEPDATVNLTTPTVSFRTDVEPILRNSCNSITCHGVTPAMATAVYPGGGLYLGAQPGMAAPDTATITSIVTALKAPSKTAPAMNIVTPSNEAQSFLIAKIHGCQNERGLACTQQSAMLIRCTSSLCGDAMPPAMEPGQLTPDQKNTIRRWVAQGALDN